MEAASGKVASHYCVRIAPFLYSRKDRRASHTRNCVGRYRHAGNHTSIHLAAGCDSARAIGRLATGALSSPPARIPSLRAVAVAPHVPSAWRPFAPGVAAFSRARSSPASPIYPASMGAG